MNEREEIVRALQLDHDGDWDGAHRIVQNVESRDAYRVHAYLHRKEGDLGNAGYWYRRAGADMPHDSLEAEWGRLAEEFGGG